MSKNNRNFKNQKTVTAVNNTPIKNEKGVNKMNTNENLKATLESNVVTNEANA